MALVKILLPLRLNDFTRLYEKPKNRKEITKDNYVIEDYLNEVVVTAGFDKKIIAGPETAIPAFQQQFNIFSAIQSTIDSSLLDIRREVQSELLDAELDKAALLLKHKQLRAAGAVAGIVLEKHLEQIVTGDDLDQPGKIRPLRIITKNLKRAAPLIFLIIGILGCWLNYITSVYKTKSANLNHLR